MSGQVRTSGLTILADDLTGALDCGAAFIGPAVRPYVAVSSDLDAPKAKVLSVNADTRRLDVDAARDKLSKLLSAGHGFADRLRFVKIDSTLRGHPGIEIAECARAVGAGLVVVCPAFPATGRTVESGVLMVHGIPLIETDVGKDPLSPAISSRVADLIGQSTDLQSVEFSTGQVRNRSLPDHFTALVEKFQPRPVIVSADAVADSDLDALVSAGLKAESATGRRVIFSGSAGLAYALSRHIDIGEVSAASTSNSGFRPPVLLVTASQRSLADRQIAELEKNRLTEIQSIDFEVFGDGPVQTAPQYESGAGQALARRKNLVLRARINGDLSGLEPASIRTVADRVTTALGSAVNSLIAGFPIGGLIIVGGDTAFGILNAAEARGIVLAAEPLPGVPVGRIEGGVLDGTPIATKAGAFGDDETLVQLFHYLGLTDTHKKQE